MSISSLNRHITKEKENVFLAQIALNEYYDAQVQKSTKKKDNFFSYKLLWTL